MNWPHNYESKLEMRANTNECHSSLVRSESMLSHHVSSLKHFASCEAARLGDMPASQGIVIHIKITEFTERPFPSRVFTHSPDSTLHSLVVLSSEAVRT